MKLNKFILPIAATLFVTTASANPYIGASYLYSEYQVTNENTDFSDQNSGYSLYLGYKINELISVEGGYTDFIDTNKDFEHIYSDAWLASTKLTLPITIFDVYGRVGVGHFQTNLGDTNDIYYGVGTGVSLGPVRVALEYTMYEAKVIENSYALSAEFHF
ncbi:porin family protein [Vibrio tubiashii]|uniref:Porin family protein n=1 Tax=Vibrio tubiashii TaxID=29498 RepID=A0AAE5GNP7_9VIBR|nr:porin [Vibrio tubiashii]NOI79907.1 porin family protein [Vibrio tubiashii]